MGIRPAVRWSIRPTPLWALRAGTFLALGLAFMFEGVSPFLYYQF